MTALSCRGPTSIRANTCRPAASVWRWLTGFTGIGRSGDRACASGPPSSSMAATRLQAAAQADTGLFEIHHLIDEPPARWLAVLNQGAIIGYDPWLHTPQEVERLKAGAERAGASLRAGRQPDRPGLAGAAAGADCAGRAARRPLRRRRRSIEARSTGAHTGRGRRRGGGADDARVDRLAVEHPRRRRAAHTTAAVLRDLAPGRQRHLVHRPAKARSRPRAPSRQRGDSHAA